MGNNVCKLSYVCARVDDHDDYDYTFVRIFGVFCLILGLASVVLGAICWGYFNTRPYGGWWGPVLTIFGSLFAICDGGYIQWKGNYGKSSWSKMASFLCALGAASCLAAAIWDASYAIYIDRYYDYIKFDVLAACLIFNGINAITSFILAVASCIQLCPCCACCYTDYDNRFEGYEFSAKDFYSYKNTMAGFGGAGGSGLFGPPPPPLTRVALRDGVNFGPPPPQVVTGPPRAPITEVRLSPPADMPTPVLGVSGYAQPVTLMPAVQMRGPMGAPVQGPIPMGAPMMGGPVMAGGVPMMGGPVMGAAPMMGTPMTGPYGSRQMGPGGPIIYA